MLGPYRNYLLLLILEVYMSRVSDMLSDIRIAIGDTKSQRWTDSSLLRLINLGVQNFNLHTNSIKRRCYIAIESNVATYDLRDISTRILRVQYNTTPLRVTTISELDDISTYWEDTINIKPTHVIFENLPLGTFKIYPKVVEDTTQIIQQNTPYGMIISIEATDGLFQLPSIENLESQLPNFLTVDYVKKPNIITEQTTDTELELDSLYDSAIVYFASGSALRYDRDAANRAFGSEQYQLYEGIVAKASKNESINNNSVHFKEVPYRGGFK